MDIKEIALKAGLANFDNYQDDGKTLMVAEFDVTDQVIRTVESAVAEIAKQNEPVGWFKYDKVSQCWHPQYDEYAERYAKEQGWQQLYTLPPTAEQIANETAEACAKACEDVIGNTPHDQRMLAAIDCAVMLRSGAWKEFK